MCLTLILKASERDEGTQTLLHIQRSKNLDNMELQYNFNTGYPNGCPLECPITKYGTLWQDMNILHLTKFTLNIQVQKYLNTSTLVVTLFPMELYLLY